MKNLLFLFFILPLCGCTTKSKAKAQAQAAFAAGQQQALAQMRQAQQTSIRVLGPVRNPEIVWTDGLTLAQVIAAADCTFKDNPRGVFIIRQRERVAVDLNALLDGRDVPLEPGDTVEIQP
jgi:hypothetical protein